MARATKARSLPGPPVTAERWGAIDASGRLVLEPALEFLGSFAEGLALAKKDGAYGYVDTRGQFVIAPAFENGRAFRGGLAVVRANGKSGVVDRAGRFITPARWDEAKDAEDGAVFVREGGLWGLLDATGAVLVEPSLEEVFDWIGGRAVVARDGRYGCLDSHGRFVLETEHDGLYPFFESLAAFATEEGWGYLREDGSVAIEPRFERADRFSEGIARVVERGSDRFGYVNPKGRFVVKPELPDVNRRFGESDASVASGGRIVYAREEDEYSLRYGLLDLTGKTVVEAKYDAVYPPAEGLVRFVDGGSAGFLDVDGRVAIAPAWDEARDFRGGRARVKRKDQWGLVDPKGKTLLAPSFDEIDEPAGGLARVKRGGKWGAIDADGRVVVEPVHELLTPFAGGLASVRVRVPDAAREAKELETVESLLKPLLAAVKGTIRPFLRLTATPVPAVGWKDRNWPAKELAAYGPEGTLRSKLGGVPWIPPNGALPEDAKGRPLVLLAQIRFDELPTLPGFPRKGLLQLFVLDDPSLGVGAKDLTKQTGFRVLFHAAPKADSALGKRLEAAAKSLAGRMADSPPFPSLAHLAGVRDEGPVTIYDRRFGKLVKAGARKALDNERVSRAYEEIAKAGGHKVGGWPLFTQDDPRDSAKYRDFDTLALQLDSDGFVEIQDAGVASLFVPGDALAEGDVSRALWTTDSH